MMAPGSSRTPGAKVGVKLATSDWLVATHAVFRVMPTEPSTEIIIKYQAI